MTIDVAVLIPVLNRPQNVEPLIESLTSSTTRAYPVFIVSPNDKEELAEIERVCNFFLVADWAPGPGDYAKKMNYAVTKTNTPWVFLAADDLRFRDGWVEAALNRPAGAVIGTNDLGNPRVRIGRHSTHTFVRRDYIEERGTIDEPGKVLHEGYGHNWVDNELVETARRRRQFSFAKNSIVEHLHPSWKKAPYDETYRKGQLTFKEDQKYFMERRKLWTR